MKKNSIKSHLCSYSIHRKRTTTINHAFASALAPSDPYDEVVIDSAIRALGQDPEKELVCVYCGASADTWDHLVGLVKDAQLRGYGHQVGNLVPCCGSCNSSKGARDWRKYIEGCIGNTELRRDVEDKLNDYQKHFARPIDVERARQEVPVAWAEYIQVKEQVIELLKRADVLAAKIRPFVMGK